MAYEPLDVTDFDKTNPFDVEKIRHLEGGIQENEKAIAEVNADLTDIDVYNGQGTAINSGDDLNDYTTYGKYYAQNGSIAASLLNCPSRVSFSLYVLCQVRAAIFQLLVRSNTTGSDIVYVRIYNTGTWGDWYCLSSSSDTDGAYFSAGIDANVTLDAASTYYVVPFTKFFSQSGDFTLTEDGGVVCPYSGVVSATFCAMISPWTGYISIAIYKNSSSQDAPYYDAPGSRGYSCLSVPNKIFSVSAGDVLYVRFRSNVATDLISNSTTERNKFNVFYIAKSGVATTSLNVKTPMTFDDPEDDQGENP